MTRNFWKRNDNREARIAAGTDDRASYPFSSNTQVDSVIFWAVLRGVNDRSVIDSYMKSLNL